jgi:hypothetical protein
LFVAALNYSAVIYYNANATALSRSKVGLYNTWGALGSTSASANDFSIYISGDQAPVVGWRKNLDDLSGSKILTIDGLSVGNIKTVDGLP